MANRLTANTVAHPDPLPASGEREKTREIHHPRNIRDAPYPRIPWRPHTGAIPLHSKGRRTREASHGEGGLQADREVRTSGKRGSAYSQG